MNIKWMVKEWKENITHAENLLGYWIFVAQRELVSGKSMNSLIF